MNMAGAVGGLLSSFVFGFFIQRFHGYDAVLLSMAAVLCAGAVLWLAVDATETLATSERARQSMGASTEPGASAAPGASTAPGDN